MTDLHILTLKAELAATRVELADARGQLADATAELAAIRGSRPWRLAHRLHVAAAALRRLVPRLWASTPQRGNA